MAVNTTREFQIRFVKDRSGSYTYFKATELDVREKAEQAANEWLENTRARKAQASLDIMAMFREPFRPVRTASVVEYDGNTNKPVRGGIKFKIRLSFIEYHFSGGRKIRDEWYKADEE